MGLYAVLNWFDVRARLHSLGPNAERELGHVCNRTADKVAFRTRLVFPYGPAPRHARNSIESHHAPGMTASVSEGSFRFPYVGWLDFGGRVGRRHANHRLWLTGGRYMFRSYHWIKPGIEPDMQDALRRACHASGFATRG